VVATNAPLILPHQLALSTQDHPVRELVPTKVSTQFGPLSTLGGWEVQASLQGPGGAVLGLWGWSAERMCGFFPGLWKRREGANTHFGCMAGAATGR
jgi:hypothetical protein